MRRKTKPALLEIKNRKVTLYCAPSCSFWYLNYVTFYLYVYIITGNNSKGLYSEGIHVYSQKRKKILCQGTMS